MVGGVGASGLHQTRLLSAIRELDVLDQRRAELVKERDSAIVGLSDAGLSFGEIAALCGLSRGRVGQICRLPA